MINWDKYFDKVFIIHYTPYKERRSNLESELNRVGLLDNPILNWRYTYNNKFTRCAYDHLVTRSPNLSYGYFQCTTEHYACYKISKDLGYSRILILEDDIAFCNDLNYIEECLNNLVDSDLILFHWWNFINPKIGDERVDIGKKVNEYYYQFSNNILYSSVCYSLNINGIDNLLANHDIEIRAADEYNGLNNVGVKDISRVYLDKPFAIQIPYARSSNNASSSEALKLMMFSDYCNNLNYEDFGLPKDRKELMVSLANKLSKEYPLGIDTDLSELKY